jgi:hypothetical protein
MSSDAFWNAQCYLLKPDATAKSTGSLQLKHAEDAQATQYCSCRGMSRKQQIAAFGQLALDAWTIRLHSTEEIAPGWRVEVIRDGRDTWETFTVRHAQFTSHWTLLVERTR